MRKTLSILCILLAVLFAYVTLTVPSFDATAPALITISLAVAARFAWPKKKEAEVS